MAFASPSRDTTATNLYWQRADRTGGARRLTTSKNPQRPSSFHPSGRYLAFEENTPATKVDVMILRLEGSDEAGWTAGTSTAFVRGPYPEFDPMFSPDGQWIAYTSVESGHPEVFVRPFPGPGGHWLIGAGANPTWSSAREIFYGIEDGRIMVVPYTVDGQSFRPGKARPVASTQYEWRGPQRMFDLHPDGTRFALAVASAKVDGRTPDKVRFVINFFDELRQKATVASSQR
jgi:serine/threonine-protein kinase